MRLFVSAAHQEIFAIIKLRRSLLLISARELIHIVKRISYQNFVPRGKQSRLSIKKSVDQSVNYGRFNVPQL